MSVASDRMTSSGTARMVRSARSIAVAGLWLGPRRARRLGFRPLGSRRDLAVRRVDPGVHLPALDRLLLLEVLGQVHELLAALGQNLSGTLVAGIDQPVDFLVDLAGDLLAVVSLLAEVAAQEDELLLVPERERAQLVGHAPLGHHAAGELRGLTHVVRGTRGDVAEDQLLRNPTAEDDRHVVVELAAPDQIPVLRRERHPPAKAHAPRPDRD